MTESFKSTLLIFKTPIKDEPILSLIALYYISRRGFSAEKRKNELIANENSFYLKTDFIMNGAVLTIFVGLIRLFEVA